MYMLFRPERVIVPQPALTVHCLLKLKPLNQRRLKLNQVRTIHVFH